MNQNYEYFLEALNHLDKEACVSLVYDWMNNGMQVEILYEEILVRALSNLSDIEENPNHKIWVEHTQSSIVRTIIEMIHPFILKQRKANLSLKAAVICPDQEQHELGARMINDYLVLHGVQSYFVGRDTPRREFVDMIQTMNLDVVAISVTNYYHISEVKKTIELINQSTSDITLLVGGRAVHNNPGQFNHIPNVVELSSSRDLFNWLKGRAT